MAYFWTTSNEGKLCTDGYSSILTTDNWFTEFKKISYAVVLEWRLKRDLKLVFGFLTISWAQLWLNSTVGSLFPFVSTTKMFFQDQIETKYNLLMQTIYVKISSLS